MFCDVKLPILPCSLLVFCVLAVTLPAADVIAHYPFDKDLSSTAGGVPEMTANGDAHIDASMFKFGGGSLAMDGEDDYAWVGESAFQFHQEDFAISFWYRRNKPDNIFEPLVGHGDSTGDIGYAVRLLPNPKKNEPGWIDGLLNDGPEKGVQTPQPLEQTGDFQHVVFQRREGTLELYLNGELVASKPGFGEEDLGRKSGFSYAFAVGTRSTKMDGSGSKGSFNGNIDEVWVFNAGLTPGQVKALKEKNKPN
jgi:hypothetical protein